jgi:hypothetical protein
MTVMTSHDIHFTLEHSVLNHGKGKAYSICRLNKKKVHIQSMSRRAPVPESSADSHPLEKEKVRQNFCGHAPSLTPTDTCKFDPTILERLMPTHTAACDRWHMYCTVIRNPTYLYLVALGPPLHCHSWYCNTLVYDNKLRQPPHAVYTFHIYVQYSGGS